MAKDLLIELKNNLLITWEDEQTDLKCRNSLDKAKGQINSLVGSEIDFEKDLFARSLLLNCARYHYNNVSEFFEDNFQKEILRLQLLEASGGYNEKTYN